MPPNIESLIFLPSLKVASRSLVEPNGFHSQIPNLPESLLVGQATSLQANNRRTCQWEHHCYCRHPEGSQTEGQTGGPGDLCCTSHRMLYKQDTMLHFSQNALQTRYNIVLLTEWSINKIQCCTSHRILYKQDTMLHFSQNALQTRYNVALLTECSTNKIQCCTSHRMLYKQDTMLHFSQNALQTRYNVSLLTEFSINKIQCCTSHRMIYKQDTMLHFSQNAL